MLICLQMLEGEEERESFRRIYENNYQKMYYAAHKILQHPEDTENAVHEAFVKLAERFEYYSGLSEGEMGGLCVVIAKNKAIDRIRARRHLSETELEELNLEEHQVETMPEESLLNKERTRQLAELIGRLSEPLKNVLILKYYYDYQNREIGKLLDISTKTVEMRLYRGKAKLKELLDDGQ